MSVYSSYTCHVGIEPLERMARRTRRPVRNVMVQAGVSRSTVAKIKSGKPVSITIVEMIAKALDCHPGMLSTGYEDALNASINPLDGEDPTAIVPIHKDRIRALMELKGLNAIGTSRLMNRHDTAMGARLRSGSTHTTVDFVRNLAAVLDIDPKDLISNDPSIDESIRMRLDEVRAERARRAESESVSREKALAGVTDREERRADDVLVQRAALLRSIFRRRMPITKFGPAYGLSSSMFYSITNGHAPGPWRAIEAIVGDVAMRRSPHEDIAPASADLADIGGGISLALLVADTRLRRRAMDACLTVPGSRLEQARIEIETILAAGPLSIPVKDEHASSFSCPVDSDADASGEGRVTADLPADRSMRCVDLHASRLARAMEMRSSGTTPEGVEILAQVGGRSRRLPDHGEPCWFIPLHSDGDMRVVTINPDGSTSISRIRVGDAMRIDGGVLTTVCDDPMALLIGVLTHGPRDRAAVERAVFDRLDRM